MALQFVPRPTRRAPNILIYGPPKSSKTAFGCSGPDGTLLLNADLPNASQYAREQDTEGRIMEVAFEGMQTMVDTILAVRAEERIAEIVVVDTVGECHRRLLEEASDRAIRPAINTYGDVSVHLERFCRALCEEPIVTVFVCHDHPVKDEATGQMVRLPWTGTTNPALGQKLMAMVDVVAYSGVVATEEGKVYAAQLISQGGRMGGDRYDALGDWLEMNLTDWLDRINNPHTPSKEDTNVQPVPAV
jgi:hypothetical protein